MESYRYGIGCQLSDGTVFHFAPAYQTPAHAKTEALKCYQDSTVESAWVEEIGHDFPIGLDAIS